MRLTIRAFALTSMFAASISIFYACSKSAKETLVPATRLNAAVSNNVTNAAGDLIETCGFPQNVPLTAGQTIPSGSVIIENDENNIYVTYSSSGDWKLKELQLSVDANSSGDCSQQKSSDLAPGKFPFKVAFTAGTEGPCSLPTSYTFTIPKTSLPASQCYCVYPHAVVVKYSGGAVSQTETAWGGDISRIVGGKWYGGTRYCLQDCGNLGK